MIRVVSVIDVPVHVPIAEAVADQRARRCGRCRLSGAGWRMPQVEGVPDDRPVLHQEVQVRDQRGVEPLVLYHDRRRAEGVVAADMLLLGVQAGQPGQLQRSGTGPRGHKLELAPQLAQILLVAGAADSIHDRDARHIVSRDGDLLLDLVRSDGPAEDEAIAILYTRFGEQGTGALEGAGGCLPFDRRRPAGRRAARGLFRLGVFGRRGQHRLPLAAGLLIQELEGVVIAQFRGLSAEAAALHKRGGRFARRSL